MFDGKSMFIILTISTQVFGGCPSEKIYNTGHCSFRIQCTSEISDVALPVECQGSTNYPVIVDLKLIDAMEKFDNNVNASFLGSITTLRISAKWPQTSLSSLKYFYRLKNLYLTGNKIQHIGGSAFYYLSQLESVDISYNNISDIRDLFRFESTPTNFEKLSLAHNNIEVLPEDVFNELGSLTELDLSYNLISNLNEEPFSKLRALVTLRLNNNVIIDLNGAVNNLTTLKHLYLRGNQIQNIDDESLKIIYHLKTFDASENHLDALKPILFSRHWKHIEGQCKMILSENHITYLPNATSREITLRYIRESKPEHSIDVLTEVDLSKNMLTEIEYNAFQAVYRLVTLDLSCNKLEDFDVNPEDLVYIKFLNLSSNNLNFLYFDNFYTMNNLQNLDLSHNKLYTIPDQVFIHSYNLKHVNMTFNDLTDIQNLHIHFFHPDGGVLDLSNNDLSVLNIPSGEGLHLSVLLLNSNKITNMSNVNIYHQSELRTLEISGNLIQDLDQLSLYLPIGLRYLDFSNNSIDKIHPSAFERFSNLRTLRLKHNKLGTIDYGVFKGLDALINLDLSYNKLEYLDSKPMMDLKSLRVLYLRSNGMNFMDYTVWFGHNYILTVYIDDNNLSCDWLAEALKNFNNGYSKMKPVVIKQEVSGNSLGGIPCSPKKVGELIQTPLVDERLLIINQKILEAIREQTDFMKYFFKQSLHFQKPYYDIDRPHVVSHFN